MPEDSLACRARKSHLCQVEVPAAGVERMDVTTQEAEEKKMRNEGKLFVIDGRKGKM